MPAMLSFLGHGGQRNGEAALSGELYRSPSIFVCLLYAPARHRFIHSIISWYFIKLGWPIGWWSMWHMLCVR